ncbi:MAG: polymer-forming cytoskeletal protein [Mucilaginibacter sp.]
MSNINALVMEGTDYLSDRVIFLDQKLTGNLFCSENIFIEKDGRLDGNICSKHLVVGGVVNGNISATELLEITKTAVIKGKVRATSICIEPGAIVNGAITIGEDKAAITTLAQRIKKHTAEEYAEARALDEAAIAAANNPITVETKQEPEPQVIKQPEQKPIVAEQKVEPKEALQVKEESKPIVTPPLPAAEQIISDEPVKKPASTPTPRPSDKPKDDNNIQRWW